jgi:hypothetical protein
VWEIVLQHRALSVLQSWHWLWVLPQVSRGFAEALRPVRAQLLSSMCLHDTGPAISKAKASHVLSLTWVQISALQYTLQPSRGGNWKTTHLVQRTDALQAALQLHGPAFQDINAAYIKRLQRKARKQASPIQSSSAKRKRKEPQWNAEAFLEFHHEEEEELFAPHETHRSNCGDVELDI